MTPDKLSIYALESFDTNPIKSGVDWRFMCPFGGPCSGKPFDDAHRSLSLNSINGLWNCKRCSAKGKAVEHWEHKTALKPKGDKRLISLQNAFALPPLPKPIEAPEISLEMAFGDDPKAKEKLADMTYLYDVSADVWKANAGGEYLQRRGLELDLCAMSDVMFSPSYFSGGAVIFPVSDEKMKVVGIITRQISGDFKGALGSKKLGVFRTMGAFEVERLTITEAPIDALSLFACYVPSVAIGGKDGLAEWVLKKCRFKTVQIAFDADTAGDTAAERLGEVLRSRGASVIRLRPPSPFKDWNEALTALGKDELTEYLKPFSASPD
jgi:hypothetical protein